MRKSSTFLPEAGQSVGSFAPACEDQIGCKQVHRLHRGQHLRGGGERKGEEEEAQKEGKRSKREEGRKARRRGEKERERVRQKEERVGSKEKNG